MSFAKEASIQRTCWKCEGSVSEHVPECPYCGAFLQDPPVPSERFASCHLSSFSESSSQQDAEGVFSVSSTDWESVLNERAPSSKSSKTETEPKAVEHWLQHWPIAIVFLGCGLLAFALLLLMFATDAGLSVTWPKNRAYLYGALGAACVYRGYLKLQK